MLTASLSPSFKIVHAFLVLLRPFDSCILFAYEVYSLFVNFCSTHIYLQSVDAAHAQLTSTENITVTGMTLPSG